MSVFTRSVVMMALLAVARTSTVRSQSGYRFLGTHVLWYRVVFCLLIFSFLWSVHRDSRADSFNYGFNLYGQAADSPYYVSNAFIRRENFYGTDSVRYWQIASPGWGEIVYRLDAPRPIEAATIYAPLDGYNYFDSQARGFLDVSSDFTTWSQVGDALTSPGPYYSWKETVDISDIVRGSAVVYIRARLFGSWSSTSGGYGVPQWLRTGVPEYGTDVFQFRSTLQAVPEPSACAMALAGLACGGFSMWRRRKRVSSYRLLLLAAIVTVTVATAATPAFAQPVNYELVPVGNPGNAADTTGYGAVAYEYQIGKYEVTIGQYAAFLNAVAKSDPYGLWASSMGPELDWSTGGHRTGIQREGVSGSFSYSTVGPFGNSYGQSTNNRPISFLTWFNSARFANWMANGKPSGPQGPSTTENGAYFINGAVDGITVPKNTENPNTGNRPTFWIPDENEWYKAAYFDPSTGEGGTYWTYATQSNLTPGNVLGGAVNQANFRRVNVYSVSQQATTVSGQNYLSDVGSFTNSASFYGTFDQTGNVWENLDPDAYTEVNVFRGGCWQDNDGFLNAGNGLTKFGRGAAVASSTGYAAGLRLAALVPEPSTYAMALAGLACGGYSLFRRRRLR